MATAAPAETVAAPPFVAVPALPPFNDAQTRWVEDACLPARAAIRRIPPHMRPAIRAWVLWGKLPGDFLRALLRNDLHGAVLRADDLNRDALIHWVRFLSCDCPAGCWGSFAAVIAWHQRGGLADRPDAAAAFDAPAADA